jgi:hypothetical protein
MPSALLNGWRYGAGMKVFSLNLHDIFVLLIKLHPVDGINEKRHYRPKFREVFYGTTQFKRRAFSSRHRQPPA